MVQMFHSPIPVARIGGKKNSLTVSIFSMLNYESLSSIGSTWLDNMNLAIEYSLVMR